MFENTFSQFFKHVFIISEDISTPCSQNVSGHIYPNFENVIVPHLKICLGHVWRYVYTMLEGMFTPSLKHVLRKKTPYLHFGNLFTYYLKACLHYL